MYLNDIKRNNTFTNIEQTVNRRLVLLIFFEQAFVHSQIYNILAKRDLTAKALDLAKQMNVMPSAVKINSAKT